jgi:hypothetical protein
MNIRCKFVLKDDNGNVEEQTGNWVDTVFDNTTGYVYPIVIKDFQDKKDWGENPPIGVVFKVPSIDVFPFLDDLKSNQTINAVIEIKKLLEDGVLCIFEKRIED